jgi:hypothetical protein
MPKVGEYFIQVCSMCQHICKARNYWRSITALRMHFKAKHGESLDYLTIKCPICGYEVFGKYELALREVRLHLIKAHMPLAEGWLEGPAAAGALFLKPIRI